MQTQCNPKQYTFSGVGRRAVVAGFDGGRVSSDGGALLLKQTDEAVGLFDRRPAVSGRSDARGGGVSAARWWRSG